MNDDRLQEIAENAESQALTGIWIQLKYDTSKFEQQRALFLHVLDRLLREGSIKLHKNGIYLMIPIDDQVDAFRRAWPKTESDSGYEDFYWWFFDPDCPAGVAWRQPDGSYLIAD